MAKVLGIRRNTVLKQFEALKTKGILIRKGGTRGFWEVKETIGDKLMTEWDKGGVAEESDFVFSRKERKERKGLFKVGCARKIIT